MSADIPLWRSSSTHLILLRVDIVHIVYDPPLEVMSLAPDTRHHDSSIFTELGDSHYLFLAWFGLFSALLRVLDSLD